MSYSILGCRFGNLVVLSGAETRLTKGGYKKYLYVCLCDCGVTKVIERQSLTAGHTISCGCKRRFSVYANSTHVAVNTLYANYRHKAIKRGLIFDLTLEDFTRLASQLCYYCGKVPAQIAKPRNPVHSVYDSFLYNGLDRLTPSNGYTLENVVSCCGKCNEAKNDLMEEEFYKWILTVVEYKQLK